MLPEYLHGVAPALPGYETVIITPLIGYLSLSEIRGRVPTWKGPIGVARVANGATVDLTIGIPTGIAATLRLLANTTTHDEKFHNKQFELPCGLAKFIAHVL